MHTVVQGMYKDVPRHLLRSADIDSKGKDYMLSISLPEVSFYILPTLLCRLECVALQPNLSDVLIDLI